MEFPVRLPPANQVSTNVESNVERRTEMQTREATTGAYCWNPFFSRSYSP